MKALKIVVIVALVYVGIVVAFESLLGYFQPANASTVIITTIDRALRARLKSGLHGGANRRC